MITHVRTLPDAIGLIERAGATDAALTIDAVHLARSGGTPADVRVLDPALISYVQLCDGPAVIPADRYQWESGVERMLPGDGELPLADLVEAVGSHVLLGVEAPSQRRREAGITNEEYAAQVMRSLLAVLGGHRR